MRCIWYRTERSSVEVDIRPAKAEALSLAEAQRHCHREQREQTVLRARLQEVRALLGRRRLDFVVLLARRLDEQRDVSRDQLKTGTHAEFMSTRTPPLSRNSCPKAATRSQAAPVPPCHCDL
jgi:hypothetical protein